MDSSGQSSGSSGFVDVGTGVTGTGVSGSVETGAGPYAMGTPFSVRRVGHIVLVNLHLRHEESCPAWKAL